MKKQIIYRNKSGKFITKKEYEKHQKQIENENWICLKLTFKIMIVIILGCSIFSIINSL